MIGDPGQWLENLTGKNVEPLLMRIRIQASFFSPFLNLILILLIHWYRYQLYDTDTIGYFRYSIHPYSAYSSQGSTYSSDSDLFCPLTIQKVFTSIKALWSRVNTANMNALLPSPSYTKVQHKYCRWTYRSTKQPFGTIQVVDFILWERLPGLPMACKCGNHL